VSKVDIFADYKSFVSEIHENRDTKSLEVTILIFYLLVQLPNTIHYIDSSLGPIAGCTDHPGVVVVITIFCDVCQFSAEKIGVFHKNLCYDHFFSKNGSTLSKKRQYFRQNFRRKYFKNHNIGP
jgi:hypothetical protein